MDEIRKVYRKITGNSAQTIVDIYGGLNSHNYLINHQDVLRLKHPSIDPLNNPKTEYLAEQLVKPLNITPKLLHFNQKTGVKLTSYLNDVAFLRQPLDEKEIIIVAETIKALHQLKASDFPTFDPINRYDIYKKEAGIFTTYPNETKLIDFIKVDQEQGPLVFCHNDLVKGNLLFKDTKLYIIDYEYAGLNHPMFDLASFISENNINDQAMINLFLKTYFTDKPIQKRTFNIYIKFLDYLWYYWAQALFKKTGQSVYKTIAHIKWKRISNR